ncbi:heparinase II/III domain-containing protein [Leucothrix arctica]|uniref:Heparinase n=1 Tax=Leucothrix arctica TaxID=1481894 RepID=A0A317C8K9_9GAMM|nr:heparinase II/III family protein [Leucothrix arctica]PWQ93713.1 heparinase [Leucothrix arctica]
MLNLSRTHDFQVHLSPSPEYPAAVNPPSFNWPENIESQQYNLELKNISNGYSCDWQKVNSPMQLSFELPLGQYQWRLVTASGDEPEQVSEWVEFEITEALSSYIAPTTKELFEQCDGREQWLMYFDEDIDAVKKQSADIYPKLKHTATLSVPMSQITYPKHYQRGQEEGKREAIANARLWIDRDLMTHALLYRVWGEEVHGLEAVERLLQFAEWSMEGPASLLRPCTWGDEVGCSLARNLFLAYHWLSPLLNENEKGLFIRPMLIRIARQISERLEQDEFIQYPGHSHTSRLPAYLGLAGLALYREHDREECEKWLSEALTIYRGILPFYGGIDGSWVEGPFYASTYSKWYHPFFLSVERLSDFSFYEHPFYQNFLTFARDFIAPEQDIHPFGDGFWCRRDGKEWPGFFSQNPLRIYAVRFGDQVDYQQSQALESSITDYRLHLLDVIPTIKQIEFNQAVQSKKADEKKLTELQALNHYYYHAGLGKLTQQQMALYYRASPFGNSSHRHGDQGNIGFFDNDVDILVPTGSYGYRFGSKHHSEWTRHTIAHNLPLVGGQGQTLDDQSAIARIVDRRTETDYHVITLDLSDTYAEPVERFHRTFVLLENYGLIIVDFILLTEAKALNWRLHSPLDTTLSDDSVVLSDSAQRIKPYKCSLVSHSGVPATLEHGYEGELSIPDRAIESDASKDVVHLDWALPEGREHLVVGCCIREGLELPQIRYLKDATEAKTVIELKIQGYLITV